MIIDIYFCRARTSQFLARDLVTPNQTQSISHSLRPLATGPIRNAENRDTNQSDFQYWYWHFQKINIDIGRAIYSISAIYCSINILAIYCHRFFNIDIAARWKPNIDIDIGNINILLHYIAQQYIDLYPWPKMEFLLGHKIEFENLNRDSSDCKVSLTSRQLRIRNVNNTRFYVAVCSKIALEESNGLIFSRNPKEDQHQQIMKESKMTLMTDSFKEINDFEWPDPSTPSPHWTAQWTNQK